MLQQKFVENVSRLVEKDPDILGLAVGGSWVNREMDQFSDLDLILITENKISDDKEKMIAKARSFGEYISGFTGEHVGEPRLLICLFDNPLIHVDIKFLTLPEFGNRWENPEILFERNSSLSEVIKSTTPSRPVLDLQWIEDRFWTWIHYTATKIGRGEFFDALNAIDFLRVNVLSPLMKLKNEKKSGGIRRVETQLSQPDLENLKITVAAYNKSSICKALDNIISIYKSLRRKLYPDTIVLQSLAEKRSLEYFRKIKS